MKLTKTVQIVRNGFQFAFIQKNVVVLVDLYGQTLLFPQNQHFVNVW